MNLIKFILVLFASTLLLSSCSTDRKLADKKKLHHKSSEYLVNKVHENEVRSDWMSAKASVDFKSEKLSDSFKMHVRMRRDSIIWISATYFSVEVARFLFTPDSVMFMDRKKKQYFVGDVAYLNEKFDLDVDFKIVQSLVLGNSVELEEHGKLHAGVDNDLYFITSTRKRKMKKDKHTRKEEVVISHWISPDNFKISKFLVHDFKLNKSLETKYTEFETIDEVLIPSKLSLDIRAENDVKVEVLYSKITLNKPLSFSFKIPSKYERIF